MRPEPAQLLHWTDGPATVELAGVAELKVPEGYRFLGARSARIMLERQRGAAPKGIAGVLEDTSGGGMVVLEYAPLGYFSIDSAEKINSDAVLNDARKVLVQQNAQRARLRLAPIKSLSWERTPVIDLSDNTLEFAFRNDLGTVSVINHSIRKFGREGFILATVQSTTDTLPLKELVAGVSFNEGHRYADHRSMDGYAAFDLTQLMTSSEFPTVVAHGWLANVSRSTMIWSVCGIGVVVLALVGFLVTKEIRDLKQQRSFDPDAGTRSRINGKAYVNGRANRHGLRLKREFDYQRYYSDMMMQVSGRGSVPVSARAEKVEKPAEVHPAAEIQGAQTVTSELIAQQQEFIEEQRRLMAQQARMIEERSRLIEEKNRILVKQSEMIESQLL